MGAVADDQPSPLYRLAAATGIELGFHDAFGVHYPLPEETAVAILRALGLPAETEAQQETSLTELQDRPWRRITAGTVVVPAECQPAALSMHVRPDLTFVDWQVAEETGREHSGRIDLQACPTEAERRIDGAAMVRRACRLSVELPESYHNLTLTAGERRCHSLLIVAPARCWQPEEAAPGRRMWGIACQLYSLRGRRSKGLGTFADLTDLTVEAAAAGADIVGLNPLHALNPADPDNHSPYSPASRDFLNILYIDPFSVPEVLACPDALAALSDTDDKSPLIDYPAVTARLLTALRHAYDGWGGAAEARRAAFAAFRARGGAALEAFGCYMALQEAMTRDDTANTDHRRWPSDLARHDGSGVAKFAKSHAEAISFHIWMQWLADDQLAAAARRARDVGMAVGLYRDLAVGVGPKSAAAWATPDRFVNGVTVGAPPDLLNRLGQNWGLLPFNPLTLADTGYAAWIEALRANMRYAGALRIDHAMALLRGYWVADGLSAAAGAYVSFPFRDLRRIMALESRRHRCLVIGEDLGTVPDGFRDTMAEAGALSYRVLMFQREGDGLFSRPRSYPEDALVTFGTHDLPTLAGFWTGVDLQVRRALGLYPSDAAQDADAADRVADRQRLIDALIDAGVWPADLATDSDLVQVAPALAEAVHRYLAMTPSRLMMVQLEDLLLVREMMNMPGTVQEHPNWRRRLPVDLATVFSRPEVVSQLAAVDEARR